ncbi:hypothetical protein CC85DRAFT_323762 [Cutaneotrichosporon oleaginosum]|uniref:GH16 domain-containing protein n=1 Tax=Cutaneotrichosporon oleaginosum TaxID=879819 RepID=A0A0J0XEI8_9TREE|nr:uncharacterized protein CC85DRAFT_323762 [Cutaneotrichosporon oleaginosum]KLT39485.1 hypothetical protein CC85DRAFT_323762 [Cutaneotrichosporon oleaginosum]
MLLLLCLLAFRACASASNATFVSQLNGTLAHDTRQLGWALKAAYEGLTFFDNFDFFSAEDPNHGMVQYVPRDQAFGDGLAFWTQNGTPGIQAEHWKRLPVGEKRRSVRIVSKNAFAGGLFIFDMALLPHGCGVWPAVWMLGTGNNWPYAGEIDIIEGVHDPRQNQMTIHTAPGCMLSGSGSAYSGTRLNEDCDSSAGSVGCSIRSDSEISYGAGFNLAGGGVFVLLWDGAGLKMWNWPRSAVPRDVVARNPTPLAWGNPVAVFDRATCDPYTYFQAQVIIMNVNLCGDWAGSTYAASGCPGTCVERVADPANLVNTVMIVNSVVVYQQTDGRSGTRAAGTFDSTVGASGPINPLRRLGAAQKRGSGGLWAAVAAVGAIIGFVSFTAIPLL